MVAPGTSHRERLQGSSEHRGLRVPGQMALAPAQWGTAKAAFPVGTSPAAGASALT